MESSHTEDNMVKNSKCTKILLQQNHANLICVSRRLEFVEHWNVIVTASDDTSARMWTLDGYFIGNYNI